MGAQTDRAPPLARDPKALAPAGDSASKEALKRLRKELADARAVQAALPHLNGALAAVSAGQFERALKLCAKALKADPSNFFGHHIAAIAHEKLGDWAASIDSYERALALNPDSPEIANDLGRLAFRMQMLPQAEALFRIHLAARPYAPESSNNLACVLREQMRYSDAIDVLKPAIQAAPDRPLLWNTLGTVMADLGETEQAAIFYTETLRLDPKHVKARYNRSNALFTMGDTETAIADCRMAMNACTAPDEKETMRLALATMLLASGDLPQGWEAYEARLSPDFHDPIHFLINRPQWTPFEDIDGKHLLLVGEQGLGDEVLFANMLDDLFAALGPGGRLSIAVDRRLVPLLQRSFPRANLGVHNTFKRHGRNIRSVPMITDWADVDCWAPMGQPLRQFRLKLEDFPERPEGFLKADPERVAYWREQFADHPGPRIGLVWTSMLINSARKKYFSPFDRWGPILQTPGATFVNLQYGDCTADIEMARREFGVEIIQPQGIDLKMDLDDVAALSCAMDLVMGPANATSNIAAACGVPTWLISTPGAWTQLGTERYPWYTGVRMFSAKTFGDWDPVIAEIAEAMGEFVGQGTRSAAAG
ncbi:tetratricopeptide repeat protein [Phenylobacterium sp.]|uniref:tetratricopeptide repeat protein n=1 Tax=Phenylobacterium sp. TaxID=1871053 RepID=UPI0035B34563